MKDDAGCKIFMGDVYVLTFIITSAPKGKLCETISYQKTFFFLLNSLCDFFLCETLFIMHYFEIGIMVYTAHISYIMVFLQSASMNRRFLNIIHKMVQILQQ